MKGLTLFRLESKSAYSSRTSFSRGERVCWEEEEEGGWAAVEAEAEVGGAVLEGRVVLSGMIGWIE